MNLKPFDHLLRTFAAVPPSAMVLDAHCHAGQNTIPLLQLGFRVAAWNADADIELNIQENVGKLADFSRLETDDNPENAFDWIVADRYLNGLHTAASVQLQLAKLYRALRAGGWVYMVVEAALTESWLPLNGSPQHLSFDSESLNEAMYNAGFALAETPHLEKDETPLLIGIYRKVEANTIA